jgi:hypothetical protein
MRLNSMGPCLCALILFNVPAFAASTVPKLDVKSSCRAAQAFGDNKAIAYQGCMDDENQAYNQLVKKWSRFKSADRTNCVGQVANLIPSYVEILTCLEMFDDVGGIGGIGGAGAAEPK